MCRSWSNLWSHLYGWICIWVNCITICITICVIFNLFGVRTICPTPNREGNDMKWECRIQRKGERVERVGVRACVGVGGRVNKNIWAKGYQNVYVFNFNMSPREMQGLNTTCLSDLKGDFISRLLLRTSSLCYPTITHSITIRAKLAHSAERSAAHFFSPVSSA